MINHFLDLFIVFEKYPVDLPVKFRFYTFDLVYFFFVCFYFFMHSMEVEIYIYRENSLSGIES